MAMNSAVDERMRAKIQAERSLDNSDMIQCINYSSPCAAPWNTEWQGQPMVPELVCPISVRSGYPQESGECRIRVGNDPTPNANIRDD